MGENHRQRDIFFFEILVLFRGYYGLKSTNLGLIWALNVCSEEKYHNSFKMRNLGLVGAFK